MKKRGFTLSEVLLVLSVIGVVASLTIPTLIQKISSDQYKTGWKKAYTTVSQAAIMQTAQEGQVNILTLNTYFSKIRDCSSGATSPQCVMSCPTGWGCNLKPSSDIFISADGMQWGDFQGGADHACAVDVNGIIGPNKLDQDTFTFCVRTDGRVLPSTADLCNFGAGVDTPNAKNWLYQ